MEGGGSESGKQGACGEEVSKGEELGRAGRREREGSKSATRKVDKNGGRLYVNII